MEVGAVRVSLVVFSFAAGAFGALVPADSTLRGLGFKDESVLYAAAQTVTEKITGAYNIQAGENGAGGKIVTIGGTENDFSGGTYVKSGTLAVPALGMSYLATALGRTWNEGVPGAPIVLAQGTLRIAGNGMTDRDFALYQDSNQRDRPATIWVEEGAEALTTGRMLQPVENTGNLLKRGPGAFVLATKTPGAVNRIGRVAALAKDGKLNQDADGNYPTAGYSAFTITDGRFVIDTADSVTNVLNQVRIGGYTTDTAGAETAGHLEIRGGVNFIHGANVQLGKENGTATTAASPLRSSIDVSGGETFVTGTVYMVFGYGKSYTACPELNVSGGAIDVRSLVLNDQCSSGRLSVSGGRLRLGSAMVGDNYSGSKLDIALSGRGELVVDGGFQYGRNTDAYGTVSIADGAVLRLARLTSSAYNRSKETVLFDGGQVAFTGGEANETANFWGEGVQVGARGGTIDVTDCSELGPECRMPITTAADVAKDGGLTIRNRGLAKRSFRFFKPVSSVGGVRAEGNVVLKVLGETYPTTFTVPAEASFGARITDDSSAALTATVGSLVYPDAIGRLEVGFSAGSPKCFKVVVTDSFTPPSGILSVGCYQHRELVAQSSPLGTWDILEFPASVDFDAGMCRIANPVSGRSYSFAVVEGDGVKTLQLTIGNAADTAESEKIAVPAGQTVTISSARDFWTTATKDTISGEGELTFADGACARFNSGVTFGVKTLNLNGGVIQTVTPFADGVTGTVNWNGTVVYPIPTVNENELFKSYSDSGAARIVLGSNGGVIDTSLMPCDYVMFLPKMSGSGTLTVRGTSVEKTLFMRGKNYGAGDVSSTIDFRVEKGGCLTLYGDNFKNHTAVVADGGAIGSNARGDIKNLTLGESASDTTTVIALYQPSATPAASERVRVLSSLTVNGTVKVAFRSNATAGEVKQFKLCCPTDGKWMVFEAPSGSIDVSKFMLDPVICAGKKGVFSVEGKVLYVTISEAEEEVYHPAYPDSSCDTTHNWKGTSGAFDDAANWDVKPELKEAENLAFAPAEDISVATAAEIPLASVVNSAAHAVKLSGGAYVFKDGATFDIADPAGVLELAGDIYGAGTLTASRSSNAGKLTVSGKIRDGMKIRKNSGYIEGRPADFGRTELQPYNATVKFLGSGVFAGKMNHGGVDTTGMAVDVAEGETVRMTGQLTSYSLLSKVGAGTFHLQCPAKANLGNSIKTPATPLFPANGDAPNGQTFNVFAGRMVLDGDVTLSGETRVGATPVLRADGKTAYDAELVILSGTADLRAFSVGQTFNYQYLDYTTLDVRPRRLVTVAGGVLECTEFVMGRSAGGANNDAGYNEVNVSGGTLRMTTADKAFAVGYDGDQASKVTKDGMGNESVLNVTAGLVERSKGGTIGIGWGVCGDVGFRPCRGTINVNGGILRTTADGKVDLAYNAGGADKATRGHVVGTLNLNGGRVEAGKLTRTCSYLCETTVNLNGGTLALLGDAASVDAAIPSLNVCAGGAKFEVGGAATVSSPLVHDASLGDEPDGGLVKTGAGTLTIAAESSFTGPVDVREGTLALADGADPITALRVDMSGTSGAITGFRTAPDAVLYIDNYPGKMRGTVVLPLALSGTGAFDTVYVNGELQQYRRAYIKDGKLTTCGAGQVLIIR